MTINRHAITLMLLLLSCLNSQAQHIVARPFPFYYQLFSNEIFDIYQDRSGYLWFGMTSGLARYDGYRLRTLRSDHQHPALFPSNHMIYMSDNDRYLWVGTAQGATLYDKQTWQTHTLTDSHIAGKTINDIKTDHEGNAWMGIGNHVVRCSPDAKQIQSYTLKDKAADDGFHQLYIDAANRVWALTSNGLFGFDRKLGKFVSYPAMPDGATPYTMFQDKAGNYWVGTWGQGLWRFHPEGRTAANCYERQRVMVTGSGAEDMIFYSMVQDDCFGYLWMLSYNELHCLEYKDGTLRPIDISKVLDARKMFTKIIKDREGNLWVGSYDMGYTIFFDRSGVRCYPLESLRTTFHHDANILTMGYAGDGILWLGQDRYGLVLYDMAADRIVTPKGLPMNEIGLMRNAHDGGMWLSARNGSHVVKATYHGTSLSVVDDINLYDVLATPGTLSDMREDRDGNLWILTSNNLYVHKPRQASLAMAGKDTPHFEAMAADSQGKMWAMAEGRVYLLSLTGSDIHAVPQGKTIATLGSNESVKAMCVDANGDLWLVTSLSRVLHGNALKGGGFQEWGESVGKDETLLNIMSHGAKVWLLTNKRLLSEDVKTHRTSVFRANTGNVMVKAFKEATLCPDLQGGILVGGHGGVMRIQADNLQHKATPQPRFAVTDILVDGNSMLFDTPDEDSHEGEVYLPSDSRNIEICFSPLVYSLNPIGTMQYKLEGVDKAWTTVTGNHLSALYNRLPKGTFRFLVRWQQPDGTWKETGSLLKLIRRPAFYETTLAYCFYALLMVLAAFLVYRLIKRRASTEALRHFHNQSRLGKMIEEREAPQETGDNKFLQEVMAVLEQHISETDYGQEQLARDLLLSRSTLYRKIKSESGMSPLDFIRNVKMKRACMMLDKHEQSISEIAYLLGFSNPKYFTKCFKEEMGMTPSEYLRLKA